MTDTTHFVIKKGDSAWSICGEELIQTYKWLTSTSGNGFDLQMAFVGQEKNG